MLLLSTSGPRAHAFTNGQSASLVIGQKDFTSNGGAISKNGLAGPTCIAFDPAGNMWVSDTRNYRIVEFKPPFTTNMDASLVIGQPDLATGTATTTASGLGVSAASGLGALTFDTTGNMWVADAGNNRVLEFSPPFSSGMSASTVIGQKSFTTANVGGSRDGLWSPGAVAFDPSGKLWILDNGNQRILEFTLPFTNGMNASLVVGQVNFDNTRYSTTRSGLHVHTGGSTLTFDASGNLWVGDNGNNRVLEFKPPFSSGMNASLVIGQPNFVTGTVSLSSSGFHDPFGVTFDKAGNLWVGDSLNNRVLEFDPPFGLGMSASLVIGEQDFTTNTDAATQNGLDALGLSAFDSSGNMWVPDFSNNRVLEFSSTVVPEFPTASLGIIAVISLAAVAVLTRRFSVRRLGL